MTNLERIRHFIGTAYEVGFASGQALGQRLEENISRYLSARPDASDDVNWDQLHERALPWLRQLPLRFQEEYEGLAAGAGLPLQRIAEWAFFEAYLEAGCSGFIGMHNGHVWLGRNNDMFVPSMWGYVLIREITGRIPTISMSLEGDIFSPSGLNKEQLWIHHQYAPVDDKPRQTMPHLPSYVFVTEALETCSSIQDVEDLLMSLDRDDGMLLMVVDGKTEEAAVLECSCQQAVKREPVAQRAVCTNHAELLPSPAPSSSSLGRYQRLLELVTIQDWTRPVLPNDLIRILADDAVEQRGDDFATVYSVVVCPGTRTLLTTLGGSPAASQGNWKQITWPW